MEVPCAVTVVVQVCASGMKAVMLAAQSVMLGSHKCVVAGGMMISDFAGWCEQQQLDLAWAPRGGCYSPGESQCFAGFVATNVHHHNTPTAY